MMYTVSYDVKSATGVLVLKTKDFENLQSAINFARALQSSPNVYGKPILSHK